MNETFDETLNKYLLSEKNPYVLSIYGLVTFLQFVLCLIGNGLQLLILPRIQEPNDYVSFALRALALSDLFRGLFKVPTDLLLLIFYDWFLGRILCKLLLFLITCNNMCGVWITVYIAFDRYINICHPFEFAFLKSKKFCKIILCSICFINILLFSVNLHYYNLVYKEELSIVICTNTMPDEVQLIFHIIISMILLYLLPVILLITFYGFVLHAMNKYLTIHNLLRTISIRRNHHHSNRIKAFDLFVVKVLLFLVIFFTLSYLPYFIVRVTLLTKKYQTLPIKLRLRLTSFAVFMTSMNSALNPWLYTLYSKKFRREIKKLFNRILKKTKMSMLLSYFSSSTTPSYYGNDSETSTF